MDLSTKRRTSLRVVTARAPVNIAVIKYWGKRDEKLILPLNDSISATLSMDQMSSKTSVALSENFDSDKLWLNGKEEDINNPRIQNCLREFRRLLLEKEGPGSSLLSCKVHICSVNDFPTAAGLASSAAGYACLVYTLACAYGFQDKNLSEIARQGSGSACRSMEGGFVQWYAGNKEDGSDSIARQIFSQDHWPELRILVLVVNDARKGTSSTSGMQRSVETSTLLKTRYEKIVPERVQHIVDAIERKDLHTFAEITMKDSNQMHAIAQDTYPPIRYMNDTSWAIIDLIQKYNHYRGSNKVAYTFDAGPNACLYLLDSDVNEVVALVNHIFPPNNKSTNKFHVGLPVEIKQLASDLLDSINVLPTADAIKYIIHTKVGRGPEVLEKHLLNDEGQPLHLI